MLLDKVDAVVGVSPDDTETAGVPITITDVLVNVDVDPPSIVLVNVVKIVDVENAIEPDIEGVPEGGMVLGEALTEVDVIPPELLFAKLGRSVEAAGTDTLGELREGGIPMTVVEKPVIVVICPLDMVVVIVNNIVVVVGEDGRFVGRGGSWVKVVVTGMVRVVVCPPETLLVSVVMMVDVTIDGTVGGLPDGTKGDEADTGDDGETEVVFD